ncbi:HTH-type transcriptional regulator YofA [wastewater metagenome]|uniref:HTH-type transcriptional regulator YofA n=2 Tax=unclassified sequences TaxID=12908 RepID=A0A5B8R6W6_9ZZZZ|nr:HTH-type transcriptional regulator YofA [uncultured organism]
MSEQRLPWDDLRLVLAIARTGSLSGAARRLRVSHATVYRRLGDLERRLGVRLFERQRSGYTPTPAGEEAAAAGKRVEDEVLAVERRVVGQDLRPSGTVRVTTTDSLLLGLLSPLFARFRRLEPDIALEVSVSDVLFSLPRREADVALRVTRRPPEHLVGQCIGTLAQAAYVSRDLVIDPSSSPDPEELDWIGPDESWSQRELIRWMDASGHDGRCRFRADTLVGMYAAVREGIGAGVLPCYLGDAEPRLTRLTAPVPELAMDLWILMHPDLRGVARIRAFATFMREAVRALQDRLSGHG